LETHYSFENFQVKNAVVTVGFFDGVHLGHQSLLQQVTQQAKNIGGEPVAITLWPHPRNVLENSKLHLISTLEEKLNLLEKAGISHTIVLEFNKEFATLTSQKFIQHFISEKLQAKIFIIGFNNYLGSDQMNDIETIENIASLYGIKTVKAQRFSIEQENISSTVIRQAISKGNMIMANHLLGRFYSFSGKVVTGQQLGRTIGFPTANVETSPIKIMPSDGVYVVKVQIDNEIFGGMLNIGFRPTVDSDKKNKTIEVNIFYFNSDIYEKVITVFVLDRLRSELKFNGLKELKAQLSLDEINAKRIIENIKHK
jgi:riboflavin kinase / FMN adenylyltransferase